METSFSLLIYSLKLFSLRHTMAFFLAGRMTLRLATLVFLPLRHEHRREHEEQNGYDIKDDESK